MEPIPNLNINGYEEKALHAAAERGNETIDDELIDSGVHVNANICGFTPIGIAILNGRRNTAQILQKSGAYSCRHILLPTNADVSVSPNHAGRSTFGMSLEDVDENYAPSSWGSLGAEPMIWKIAKNGSLEDVYEPVMAQFLHSLFRNS